MSLQNRNTIEAQIENLKLKDIQVFLLLSKTLNIRELSRKTQLSPGQISKTIVKLEKALNIKLFNRSTTGLSISSDGRTLAPKLKRIYENLVSLQEPEHKKNKTSLTLASSSFFVSHLLPKAISTFNNYQFNLIELPPEDYVQVGLRSGFNLCVHTAKLDWPKTWHSEFAGNIVSKLYAAPQNPLFKRKSLSKKNLEHLNFVSPAYWTREGLKYGNDQFPKNLKRTILHRTSTALSAAALISHSENVGFLPSTIADVFNLKEVKTSLIKPIKQRVYITVKSDEVSQNFYSDLLSEISKNLAT